MRAPGAMVEAQARSRAKRLRSARPTVLEGAFVSGPQDHAGRTARAPSLCASGVHTSTSGSPGSRPGKPTWGIGDERSLPQDLENLEKRCGRDGADRALPTSSPLVLQQPSRKKPVLGSASRRCFYSPRTFRGEFGRPPPFPLSSLSSIADPGPPPLPPRISPSTVGRTMALRKVSNRRGIRKGPCVPAASAMRSKSNAWQPSSSPE